MTPVCASLLEASGVRAPLVICVPLKGRRGIHLLKADFKIERRISQAKISLPYAGLLIIWLFVEHTIHGNVEALMFDGFEQVSV